MTNWTRRQLPVPEQLGTDRDWQIAAPGFAIRNDGSVWRWGVIAHGDDKGLHERFAAEPELWRTGPAGTVRSFAFDQSLLLVVLADGSVWVTGGSPLLYNGPLMGDGAMTRLFDRGWTFVRGIEYDRVIGVMRDGSLWQTGDTSRRSGRPTPWSEAMEQVSRHSDWIAVAPDPYGRQFLALTRAGALCVWESPRPEHIYDPGNPDPRAWLLPSRIKARKIAMIH